MNIFYILFLKSLYWFYIHWKIPRKYLISIILGNPNCIAGQIFLIVHNKGVVEKVLYRCKFTLLYLLFCSLSIAQN